jgi:predicted DNA-binding transcriptional regulator AlpA
MGLDEELKSLKERERVESEANPLLSIEELAASLGVSVRTIRRLHAMGEGPDRVRIGRRQMYRKLTVDAWCAATGRRMKR